MTMADHEWTDTPSYGTVENTTECECDRRKVIIHAVMNYYIEGASIRVCARCGQESVNGSVPEHSCDEALVGKIMDE